MSRYRGPRLRIVRRLGDLPGLTRKSPRRSYPPDNMGRTVKNVLNMPSVWRKSKSCALIMVSQSDS
jgi:hypothetical protein